MVERKRLSYVMHWRSRTVKEEGDKGPQGLVVKGQEYQGDGMHFGTSV